MGFKGDKSSGRTSAASAGAGTPPAEGPPVAHGSRWGPPRFRRAGRSHGVGPCSHRRCAPAAIARKVVKEFPVGAPAARIPMSSAAKPPRCATYRSPPTVDRRPRPGSGIIGAPVAPRRLGPLPPARRLRSEGRPAAPDRTRTVRGTTRPEPVSRPSVSSGHRPARAGQRRGQRAGGRSSSPETTNSPTRSSILPKVSVGIYPGGALSAGHLGEYGTGGRRNPEVGGALPKVVSTGCGGEADIGPTHAGNDGHPFRPIAEGADKYLFPR